MRPARPPRERAAVPERKQLLPEQHGSWSSHNSQCCIHTSHVTLWSNAQRCYPCCAHTRARGAPTRHVAGRPAAPPLQRAHRVTSGKASKRVPRSSPQKAISGACDQRSSHYAPHRPGRWPQPHCTSTHPPAIVGICLLSSPTSSRALRNWALFGRSSQENASDTLYRLLLSGTARKCRSAGGDRKRIGRG